MSGRGQIHQAAIGARHSIDWSSPALHPLGAHLALTDIGSEGPVAAGVSL